MSRSKWALIVVAVLCVVGLLVPTTWYEALFGVLIGAAISYFVSWYFYQAAADELKIEAEELRKLHNATLDALPIITDGQITVIRDERGYFLRAENSRSRADSVDVTDSIQTKLEKDRDRDRES